MLNKAVFPVAGLGTRFLPATKANPKEMLPIVDKPLIQYAVEEAIEAGFTELIFVTSGSKRSIEDHFDRNLELEAQLAEKQKYRMQELVRKILPKGVSCLYIRQAEPAGLGHAVLTAKKVIGDEPFAVLLADDLMDGCNKKNCLAQMVEQYNNVKSSIIAVNEVAINDVQNYGIVSVDENFSSLGEIKSIVEKPEPKDAPSRFAAVGRYILTPQILQLLDNAKPGANNEIQLTDSIDLLSKSEKVYAYDFAGYRYDCGKKLGYMHAVLDFGLKHPEIGSDFKKILLDTVKEI